MRNQVAIVFAVLVSASISASQAVQAQSLTGVVYAPDGATLAETDVTLLFRAESYPSEDKVVRTTADGRYRVDGLAVGPVTVSARSAVGWAALGDLAIGAAGEPVPVDIRLHAGATLEVQVLDMRRQPVAGAEFRLGGPFDAWQQIPCTADGRGRAVIRHLAPGYYTAEGHPWRSTLTLLGPDDRAQVTLFTDPTAKPPSATATEPVAAPVPAPRPLTGTVYGPDGGPLSAAKVFIDYFPFDNPEFVSPQGLTLTDADGRFSFEDIAPGHHWLAVSQGDAPLGFFPFYASGPDARREPVTVVLPGDRGGLAGTVMDPVLGASIAKAEVIVAKRAPLSPGFLGWPQGVNVSTVTSIGGMDGKPADVCWRAETGEDGRFAFGDLLPGDYTIIARANGVQVASDGVVVEPGGTTSIPPLRLYAKDALKLTGRVTTQEAPGTGLAGTQVSVFAPNMYDPSTRAVTDANGGFAISVGQPGWYSLSTTGATAEARVYYGAIARSDGRPTLTDIVLPEGTSGHCGASVKVVLPTGQVPQGRIWVVPLQSSLVVGPGPARPRPRFDLLTYMGDGGACTFDRLPPGRYRFLARAEVNTELGTEPPMQGTSEEVVINSAAIAEAVTVLEYPGRITGQVTREDGSAAAGVMVGATSMVVPWQLMAPEHFVATDETGGFAIEAVEPSAYAVSPVAWLPCPDGSPAYTYLAYNQALVAPGLTVSAPTKLPRDVEPVGTMAGPPPIMMTIGGTVVYDADGRPAAGVQIGLLGQGYPCLPPMVLTDAAGRFRLTVMQDEWAQDLVAWTPGYAESWLNLWSAGIGPDKRGPVEGVLLRLGRGGTIAGKVILPDDDPALGDLVVRAPQEDALPMVRAGGVEAGTTAGPRGRGTPAGPRGRGTTGGRGGRGGGGTSWRGRARGDRWRGRPRDARRWRRARDARRWRRVRDARRRPETGPSAGSLRYGGAYRDGRLLPHRASDARDLRTKCRLGRAWPQRAAGGGRRGGGGGGRCVCRGPPPHPPHFGADREHRRRHPDREHGCVPLRQHGDGARGGTPDRRSRRVRHPLPAGGHVRGLCPVRQRHSASLACLRPDGGAG